VRILIADDDKIPLSLLRFQLEQWGHTVLAAENGMQAWEMFQNHDCQVVITDWKHEYNHHRRHSALRYQAPANYAATCTHHLRFSPVEDQARGSGQRGG